MRRLGILVMAISITALYLCLSDRIPEPVPHVTRLQ